MNLHKIFVPESDAVPSNNKFYLTFPYFGAQSDKLVAELTIL